MESIIRPSKQHFDSCLDNADQTISFGPGNSFTPLSGLNLSPKGQSPAH